MTTFVGTEFVIGFGLIKKLRQGKSEIFREELWQMAQNLQNRCNTSGVDAVVLTDFDWAIASYPDYFVEDQNRCVKCAPGVRLGQLEERFMGYLPLEVMIIIAQECLR